MKATVLALALALVVGCGDDAPDGGSIDASASIDAPTADDDAGAAADAGDGSDASEGISCGAMTCGSTQECCVGAGDPTCVDQGTCATTTVGCDGPEDCEAGDACCGGAAGSGTMCTLEPSCATVVCHTADDCPGVNDQCCAIGAANTSFCRPTCPGN